MKTLYRTAFDLGSKPAPSIDEVAGMCVDWVFTPKGTPRQGVSRPSHVRSLAQPIDEVDIGAGWKVSAVRCEDASGLTWGLKLRHPDYKDPALQWTTELVLAERGGALKFTCCNGVARVDADGRPPLRMASTPNIVTSLVDKYGASDGARLLSTPIWLGVGDLDRFVEQLLSPERRHAVLLMSCVESRRCLFNPNTIARKLSAVGHVYVVDRHLLDELARRMPNPKLQVWDGAARIYRPGFTFESTSSAHPLIHPSSISETLDTRGEPHLIESILNQLALAAADRGFPNAIFWQDLESLHRSAEILRISGKAAEDGELAGIFLSENTALKDEILRLNDEMRELREDRDELQDLNRRYLKAVRDVRLGANPDIAFRSLPEVGSVAEAVSVASKELNGRVLFRLNSKSDEDTPFKEPTDLLYALRWLGREYHDARTGVRRCPDLGTSLKSKLSRWDYSAGQSETTVGSNREWYACDYTLRGGEKGYANSHVGCGRTRKPEETIRVGFLWDPDAKLVVVGYIGQHQKNQLT